LSDVDTFSQTYLIIFGTATRKLAPETMESFEWILKSKNSKLIQNLARNVSEVSLLFKEDSSQLMTI